MVYCFLAEGFEELEAIGTVDMLKRARIEIKLVGIGAKNIVGAHGIEVVCDCTEGDIVLDGRLEAVILPGGMPGTLNLEADATVQKAIDYANKNNLIIAAICAAPQILGHKGLLAGKEAIVYPGFEKELEGANISDDYVVADGNIITARGAGVAAEFGLKIVSTLKGQQVADEIRAAIQMK